MYSGVRQSKSDVPSQSTKSTRKSQLGQFFTPARIARFMAELLSQGVNDRCRLLDAGAGTGALSAAFLDRWVSGGLRFSEVKIDAFEIDELLHPLLHETLIKYKIYREFSATIRHTDFIITASEWLSASTSHGRPITPAGKPPTYTHAILNPPYQKIRSNSEHRAALRRAGIETVNLYSAFVALSLELLDDQGQLVAIIPRSFCNGPYYRPFREFLLQRAALRRLHLFGSRTSAFKRDNVLQENVIILLERGGRQGPVTVSASNDDTFSDLTAHEHPLNRIVYPDDPEHFIHVPTPGEEALDLPQAIRYSLADLDLEVSTGPVVDFRLKPYLRHMPEEGTVPLLYPLHFRWNHFGVSHFRERDITWPIPDAKKPNAIQHNDETEKWLYPNGFYCVVRRFSSKEETRRIVSSVVDPAVLAGASMLGLENHLNVFHAHKRSLPEMLSRGLVVFLSSSAVDACFRRFSGHTQVNATDLRRMRYPSRETLVALGQWANQQQSLSQKMIDGKIGSLDDGRQDWAPG